MISGVDIERVAAAAWRLPAAVGAYVEEDFVTNLLASVVDFQMQTAILVKALGHFQAGRSGDVRTVADMQALLDGFADDWRATPTWPFALAANSAGGGKRSSS